jgi:hypothetical protein
LFVEIRDRYTLISLTTFLVGIAVIDTDIKDAVLSYTIDARGAEVVTGYVATGRAKPSGCINETHDVMYTLATG